MKLVHIVLYYHIISSGDSFQSFGSLRKQWNSFTIYCQECNKIRQITTQIATAICWRACKFHVKVLCDMVSQVLPYIWLNFPHYNIKEFVFMENFQEWIGKSVHKMCQKCSYFQKFNTFLIKYLFNLHIHTVVLLYTPKNEPQVVKSMFGLP